MKFKRNFFSTYILIFNTLMIVGITPMLIAMFSIFDVEDSPNPFSMVWIILVVLLVLDIFFSIVNIVTWPFSKKDITLKNNTIMYNNKTINISEIDKIYFEFGEMSRTSTQPCCLSLYKNNQLELSITHISFIALIIILLKSKKVPKRLAPKSLLIIGGITYSIAIIISIVCLIIK